MVVNILEVGTIPSSSYLSHLGGILDLWSRSSTCIPRVAPFRCFQPPQYPLKDQASRACPHSSCPLGLPSCRWDLVNRTGTGDPSRKERATHAGGLHHHDRDAWCSAETRCSVHLGILQRGWEIFQVGGYTYRILSGIYYQIPRWSFFLCLCEMWCSPCSFSLRNVFRLSTILEMSTTSSIPSTSLVTFGVAALYFVSPNILVYMRI